METVCVCDNSMEMYVFKPYLLLCYMRLLANCNSIIYRVRKQPALISENRTQIRRYINLHAMPLAQKKGANKLYYVVYTELHVIGLIIKLAQTCLFEKKKRDILF